MDIIEEIAHASHLLRHGRAYGFAVTATPEALAMLRESKHPGATMILANVCPVAIDPYTMMRENADIESSDSPIPQ